MKFSHRVAALSLTLLAAGCPADKPAGTTGSTPGTEPSLGAPAAGSSTKKGAKVAPKPEAPKTDAPAADAPKTDAPAADAPKALIELVGERRASAR
jgi:hypothetical protein